MGLAYALSPTIRLSADAGPLLLETADGSTEITAGGSVNYVQEFEYGRLSLLGSRPRLRGQPCSGRRCTTRTSRGASRLRVTNSRPSSSTGTTLFP